VASNNKLLSLGSLIEEAERQKESVLLEAHKQLLKEQNGTETVSKIDVSDSSKDESK